MPPAPAHGEPLDNPPAGEEADNPTVAAPPGPPVAARDAVPVRLALPRQSQVFFFLVLGLMLFLTWRLFSGFLIYIVAGVFVAVLAMPIDKFWEQFFSNRVAAFCTMFTLLVIMAIPLAGLGVTLANDAQDVAQAIEDGKFETWVDSAQNNSVVQSALAFTYPDQTPEERNATMRARVDQGLDRAQDWLKQQGTEMLQRLPAFFIALTVILFVVYYVLTDGVTLVSYIRRSAPLPAAQVDFILAEARQGLRAVFSGQILTSLIQGAVGGIGFLIAGVPGAILWAAVMALFSLLPFVGAFMVWLPAALILIYKGEVGWGVFLILWGLVFVSLVDNFVRPKLIGDRASIHPLFVLIGVLGGVAAFGFIGLFLGPLLVGVTLSVLKVWERHYRDPAVGGAGMAP